MFGKAANLFEKEISLFLTGLLNTVRLRYPEDLGDVIKGNPPYDRLMLGQLATVIREAANREPTAVAAYVPRGRAPRFVDAVLKVNATWVDTKHGQEVDAAVLLSRMRTMLTLATLLNERGSAATMPNKPFQPPRSSPTLGSRG